MGEAGLGLIVLIVICIWLGSTGARRTRNSPIAGVCGGLARHFGLNPAFVRLIALLCLICSFGTALLIYIVLCFALNKE